VAESVHPEQKKGQRCGTAVWVLKESKKRYRPERGEKRIKEGKRRGFVILRLRNGLYGTGGSLAPQKRGRSAWREEMSGASRDAAMSFREKT